MRQHRMFGLFSLILFVLLALTAAPPIYAASCAGCEDTGIGDCVCDSVAARDPNADSLQPYFWHVECKDGSAVQVPANPVDKIYFFDAACGTGAYDFRFRAPGPIEYRFSEWNASYKCDGATTYLSGDNQCVDIGLVYAPIVHTHAHGGLTGVGANDHHPQLHAASHSEGAGDEVTAESLGSGCTNLQVLGGTAVVGGVECQADQVNDADADPNNEIELPLAALADYGDVCPASQVVRRNSGDTANECFAPIVSTLTSGFLNKGTADPGTCAVGDLFMNTTGGGIFGQTLKVCTATNTWRAFDSPFVNGEVQSTNLKSGNFILQSGITFDGGALGAEFKLPQQDVNPTAAGQTLYHPTSKFLKYGDGTTTHEVVDVASTQTIGGVKTFSFPTLQSNTPGLVTGLFGYNDTLKRLEVGDSAGQVDIYKSMQIFSTSNPTGFQYPATNPYWMTFNQGGVPNVNQTARPSRLPYGLRCDRLTVARNVVPSGGQTVQYHLWVANAATALTCTVDGSSANGTNCDMASGSGFPRPGTQCCHDQETTPVVVAPYADIQIRGLCLTGCPATQSIDVVNVTCAVTP